MLQLTLLIDTSEDGMTRRTLLLIFVLVAAPLSLLASEPRSATILCYHIVESPQDTRFSITTETFRLQMQYLASAGYNVIPLAELYEYISGKRDSIPENAVVVTVDDGWRSTYTHIYPEMQRLGFPFTVFIYPKFIGASAYALTSKQIREMSDNGVDIQSHTYSHSFLTAKRHSSLGPSQYSAWLRRELQGSREQLEAITGKPVRFLAYPYGDYDDALARRTAAAGYEAALTADFGSVKPGSDPFKLRRVVIYVDTNFAEFRRHLGPKILEVRNTTPSSGTALDAKSPVVSAKIVNFESLEPDSVGMAILSAGRLPYSFNPADGSISLVVREPLKGKRHQVVVWGKDRKTGRRAEHVWSFTTEATTRTATVAARSRQTTASDAAPDALTRTQRADSP
jgi:peptidoglycan/xylan/chitin deacetylase (PgdA/CDA1 family)